MNNHSIISCCFSFECFLWISFRSKLGISIACILLFQKRIIKTSYQQDRTRNTNIIKISLIPIKHPPKHHNNPRQISHPKPKHSMLLILPRLTIQRNNPTSMLHQNQRKHYQSTKHM